MPSAELLILNDCDFYNVGCIRESFQYQLGSVHLCSFGRSRNRVCEGVQESVLVLTSGLQKGRLPILRDQC